jgi:cyclase
MRRLNVLLALVAVAALSVALKAVQQPSTEKPKLIAVEKLRDNLYLLRGGGGNTAVFVTASGVVVVDTKLPGWGAPLLAKIKELTPNPVTTIINTHTHFDHVSGNVEFPPTVDVIAHENTVALMKEMRSVTGLPPQETNIFTENQGRGLAKRGFKDTLSLGKGADQVDLHYFGRGHTSGDAWVVFPALRVAHAGDIFPAKDVPILDANNGGSGVAIGDTLAKAAAGLAAKNVDTIITGHSTNMTVADLNEYADFNKAFLAAVREGRKAGRSADEIASTWKVPAAFVGYATPQTARLRSNTQVILNELK